MRCSFRAKRRILGKAFPLAGFFYTGPERDTIFHQFHRDNDQAPIVALAQLVETFPDHADWMKWYSTIALYAEYQEKSAATTAMYGEGYDWAQQYSVSSGDFVGSLPVGISRLVTRPPGSRASPRSISRRRTGIRPRQRSSRSPPCVCAMARSSIRTVRS
jgi:hypothetical protein